MKHNYSAGLVSQSFWFVELKKVVRMLASGEELPQIKTICVQDNLFGAPNENRAKEMTNRIVRRAAALDPWETQLFVRTDLATQKLLALIAVLRLDRLFFEFLYEVYREKVIFASLTLETKDANVFFRAKEPQSTVVESWTDGTKSHLRQCYFNYMTDANLLMLDEKVYRITPPILDAELEMHLNEKGECAMVKAITGAK